MLGHAPVPVGNHDDEGVGAGEAVRLEAGTGVNLVPARVGGPHQERRISTVFRVEGVAVVRALHLEDLSGVAMDEPHGHRDPRDPTRR